MKFKKILAVSAAVLGMFCTSLNVCADTLAEHDGLKYRVSESGEESLYTGWTKKGSDRYYYKNGEMKKNCWLTVHGKRKYFLQADGKRATGEVTIQGVTYQFDENGVILPDEWGLTLTINNVTRTGCTLVFTQSGGNPTGELETGARYIVEEYKNGIWTEVAQVPSEIDRAWADIACVLEKDSSREFPINWEDLYGELPYGRYRIGKNVNDFRKTADYDSKMYYAYFDVKPSDSEKVITEK